jgi:transcriptional regulator NrdR family protein
MSAVGMKCEACGGKSQVLTTRRGGVSKNSILRRRICKLCNRRWSTFEIDADVIYYFIKKSAHNDDHRRT